ncbi:hypothetical protein LMB49_10815 [Limosilactobacillus reuteri]|uniref:hypothetical protein n=1 Tax=Limosilactobacillus reuteri TaxID=1598 RepID=UPI001E55C803|nr:hypothetical protein [Limosilactobacillus reuteri]MCC4370548.1 hypothetical protein [Limosilactobacillus reuteri]MCC4371883.1 hypothetical protein [Limosilactobacillus reuteri]MCC4509397.1 hypothetical protein [Limosilactobacillus reuteri]
MVSEAQRRANKKWNDKHKEENRIYRYRSYARKYVKDIASEEDLEELQQLINDRMKKY